MSVSVTDRYSQSGGSSSQSQSPFSKSAPVQGSSVMSLPYQTAPSSLPSPPPTVSPAEVLSTVLEAFPAAVLNAPTSTPASSPASSESLPSTSPTESSRQSASSSEPSRPTGPQLQLLVPPPLLNWKTPGDIVALKLGDAAAAASAAAAAVSAAAAIPFNSAAETLYAGLSAWPLTSVPKPPGWPVSLSATAAAVAAVTAEGREAFAAGGQREGSTDLALRNGASPGNALVVSNPGSSTSSACPSEWFVCDDVSTTTRYFVVQGSDTFDHWRVNLTFDPVLFEDPAWGVKVGGTLRAVQIRTHSEPRHHVNVLVQQHGIFARLSAGTRGGCPGNLSAALERPGGAPAYNESAGHIRCTKLPAAHCLLCLPPSSYFWFRPVQV